MMILIHIDWAGTEEQLKELDKGYKIAAEETEGIDFKGRLTPWNKKYHYTYVLKADDITKFHKFGEYFFLENTRDRSLMTRVSENTRDRSLMTHGEYEFYS